MEIKSSSQPTQTKSCVISDPSDGVSRSGPFETLVSISTLDHVQNLDKAILWMSEQVDRNASNPRLALLQGAPWNDVITFQNAVCAPLAVNPRASHQGYLLNRAMEILSEQGFGHFKLKVVTSNCRFPEETVSERAHAAADILAGLWHGGEPREEEMRRKLIPYLEMYFRDTPYDLGNDLVMLEAFFSLV